MKCGGVISRFPVAMSKSRASDRSARRAACCGRGRPVTRLAHTLRTECDSSGPLRREPEGRHVADASRRPALQGATDTDVWYVGSATGGTAYVSDFLAFTTTAQFTGIGATMAAGKLFVFAATADCWISQGSNPTATKGAGSRFVKAGVEVVVDGAQGAKLAVLQDATGGNAS
jgi:hypothetical protein